jgi:hypothetical protein
MMENTVLQDPDAPGQVRKTAPKALSAALRIRQFLMPLASLRLTVLLMALSVVLVFCGTLAQIDAGIWTIVNEYFRTAMVWIPLQIFFPRDLHVAGAFPFPGGWLIGGLLLVNLLAAHAVRFRLSWKRSGILLLHAGIVVMMLSELVTGLFAVEGRMTIEQGGSSNFVEQSDKMELAIIDRSDPKTDDVVAIPGNFLKKEGLIEDSELPFDVDVLHYMKNSNPPSQVPEGAKNPATAGDGVQFTTQERPEGSAVDPEQRIDYPSAYVTFTDKETRKSLGTYLVSLWLYQADRPQKVQSGGKTYDVYLRLKRNYKPYTIHLLKFQHDIYIGTDKPKNFSSLVRLVDPTHKEDRKVSISMNSPLRYDGETFYQASFLPKDQGTVLQVVRNPGWEMPYLSCGMVAIGMLIHFGQNLAGFLRKRAA